MNSCESAKMGEKSRHSQPYIVEPHSGHHTHTFILLHGLGSNGEKFGAELLESGVSSERKTLPSLLPSTRFVFPTARKRRSTAFGRATINQWFDIASLEDPTSRRETQSQGLAESAQELRAILNREIQTISSQNIILGGISQGCAMALFLLLSLEFPIGGFVGLSGWLPFRDDIDEIARADMIQDIKEDGPLVLFGTSDKNIVYDPQMEAIKFVRDILSLEENDIESLEIDQSSLATPVFLGHGEDDQKVRYKLGEQTTQTLHSLGMLIQWKGYSGLGHWYKIPDEIDDIVEFLRTNIGTLRS